MKEVAVWAEKLDEAGSKTTIRLDDKSQQTGTVAGVFLAAAIGFLKPDSLAQVGSRVQSPSLILLLVGVASLICSVGFCLCVTWLRLSPIPIALAVVRSIAEDVAARSEDELTDDVKLNVYREHLRIWERVLLDRVSLNKTKAKRLKIAQTLLASGIVSTSCLLLLAICSTLFRL